MPNCDLEEFMAQVTRLGVYGNTWNIGFDLHNQTYDVHCLQKKTAMLLKLRWGGNA